MNKYPPDALIFLNNIQSLVDSDGEFRELVAELILYLEILLSYAGESASDWPEKAYALLKDLRSRNMDYKSENYAIRNGQPVKKNNLPQNNISIDSGEGDELSEAELASYFKEALPIPKKAEEKQIDDMSLEEIEALEAAQNNSIDIYKVSARVKNAARLAVKGNLTAQGDMVCNMFTHTIMAIYGVAQTVQDRDIKARIMQLAKQQEDTPANLIAALGAGVKIKN